MPQLFNPKGFRRQLDGCVAGDQPIDGRLGGVDVQKDAKDALVISYEAGGIVVKKPFAPWCAEWITVEARLSGQAEVAQASDFVLSVSDFGDVACQQFSPGEGGVHLARFRLRSEEHTSELQSH